MKQWTNEQRRAIEENGNLLVSAAAGSGKTAVLTERFVRLVAEGASAREFLCVTFTNAAAAEMKKRVENGLAAAAGEAEDEAVRARLHDAARDVVQANISTLHSFCAEVLRRHFHEAGLDPAFRVADEAETLVMKQEAWDLVAEERYALETGSFSALIEALGGNETRAAELILGVYEFALAQPEPLPWLSQAVERYQASPEELEHSPAVAELLKRSRHALAAALDRLQGMRDTIAEDAPKLAAHLDGEILAVRGLLLHDTRGAYAAALAAFPGFVRISWSGAAPDARKAVEHARDALKKEVKAQQNAYAEPLSAEAGRLHAQYPAMRELYETVAALDARYAEAKAERAVIDYSDMEHKVLALFQNEAVAGEYRRRFRYVFMDEYQDTNPVQELILSAIVRDGGLFLVGDVKQSIYRFRMAEPRLFMERYACYRAGHGGERIDLNANFRSTAAVVNAVNGVFSRIMTAEAAEIDYDAAAALVHGRDDQGCPGGAELCIADMENVPAAEPEDEEDEALAEAERPDAVALEAAMAAERIHALMAAEQIRDKETGELRALHYSDFVVLLRSHRGVAELWTETLALHGVPAYAELTGGFFDAVEVRVFMELLRTIDNRRRDISLAAVLRSPIGGFTTEEIARLRAEHGRDEAGTPLACVDSLARAAAYDTPLGAKASAILRHLEEWQELSRLLSVEELCGYLLDETGYGAFCRALPGGKQRAANLAALVERARLYERSGARGLSAFLSFMEKVVGTGTLGAAQTAGADVVRVMSVHKSKGLEFPVVIVAGLSKPFNRMAARAPLAADGVLGVGAKLEEGGFRKETIYKRAIAARAAAKDLAEEMRVLYVAMTRARDRLILLAALPNAARAVREAALPLSPARAAAANSFLDWVLGAVLQTQDGDILRKRFGLPWKRTQPGGWMQVSVRPAVGTALLDGRMRRGEYERFARMARAEGGGAEFGALFTRRYAHAADTVIPSRVTVTGLAGHEITMAEAPGFAEKDARFGAAARGTAVHALLSAIPLRPYAQEEVVGEIVRLREEGVLCAEEAESIRPAHIAAFFASPLGRRLLASETVRRELEFNYRVSARHLLGADTDEPILLQGVIDCCFLEEGAWVLLDYKTDFVPPGTTPEEAAAKHARQLTLYAEALAALTATPVREAYICLLGIDENVRLL